MATVYLAEDLKHHRKVAIKVLRPELAASLGSDRFAREIEVAARLTHPNILGLLDSGAVHIGASPERSEGSRVKGSTLDPQPSTLLYYVMPYVEGETLRTRLQRAGPLPITDAIQLTREIAEALAKAHKAGIVHRDIKPENILIADGHALVMDFGVAKAVSSASASEGLTSATMTLGTPAYMAPEQVAADPGIDHRADIYSLGLVAYEMLVGGSPYTATTPQQQMAAHVTTAPSPLLPKRPDCPPTLAALIMRCLAKQPGERWQAADEIVAALGAMNSGTHPGHLPAARKPWLLIGAVVVLGVLAGLVYLRFSTGRADRGIEDHSVGVMLFNNITHDTADAYLADGLSSEITSTLARVPRLDVRSPGAVRSAQRGGEADPQEIGRRLKVGNVVEGEFQRGGDKIRIAVRLVSVATGTVRWDNSWTRPAADLLAVQEEIAQAVAKAIGGQLMPAEQTVLARHPTDNAEAYDHFLRGNFLLARRRPDMVAQAITEYSAAIRLDPAFAQAQARIAEAHVLFAEWGWSSPGISPDSQVALAFSASGHALELDSTLADGWMARGLALYLKYPRTIDGAIEALKRATVLDSTNAEAWHQYGSQILIIGQYEEAIRLGHRALTLEPGRAITWENMADAYDLLHRYAEGAAAHDSALAADSQFVVTYAIRTWGRLRSGDRAGARRDAEAAMRFASPTEQYNGLAARAAVAAADGDTALGRSLMAQAVQPFASRPLGPLAAQMILYGFVSTGQRQEALDLLERVTPRGVLLWWTLQYPEVDPIRQEPRFKKVIEESKPVGR